MPFTLALGSRDGPPDSAGQATTAETLVSCCKCSPGMPSDERKATCNRVLSVTPLWRDTRTLPASGEGAQLLGSQEDLAFMIGRACRRSANVDSLSDNRHHVAP